MRTTVVCIVAIVVSAIGCGKKEDPIVGTWRAEPPALKGVDPKLLQGMSVSMTFNADGSMVQNSSAFGVHSTSKGTYTATKNSLTFTMTSVEAKADDPNMQAKVDQSKKMAESGLNKPQTTTLTWVSNDQMKLEVQGQGGFTFDRVKS